MILGAGCFAATIQSQRDLIEMLRWYCSQVAVSDPVSVLPSIDVWPANFFGLHFSKRRTAGNFLPA